MNNCISAELTIITVDFSLNGITMSTDEYSLGHFSLLGSGEYDLASRGTQGTVLCVRAKMLNN